MCIILEIYSSLTLLTHWPLVCAEIMLKVETSNSFSSRCFELFLRIAHRRIPENLFDEKSTLVQVMAWCRQTGSHYLSQCWPGSMPPCDVNRPQWVNPSMITLQRAQWVVASAKTTAVAQWGAALVAAQMAMCKTPTVYVYVSSIGNCLAGCVQDTDGVCIRK